MAYIKVDTDALDDSVGKLSKLQERMDSVQQRLSTLSSQLDWEIKGREELDNRLNQLKSQIGTIGTDIGSFSESLSLIKDEYIAANSDCRKETEGLLKNIPNTTVNIGPIYPTPCPAPTPTPAPAKTVSRESYFVSPPSEIEIAAYNYIDNKVDSLMKMFFYRPFPLELISVYEYTFVRTFKDRIERQEATIENRERIFKDIDNLTIIWQIISGNFDPSSIGQPGIGDIPNALNINKKIV